jgi:serine/threonine protein kinase
MEFADEGDLEEKIKEKRKNSSYFDENEIWNVFIQSLRGLCCLHEAQILHRDLKVSFEF